MTAYRQYRRLRALARADRMAGLTESAECLTVLADRLAVSFALRASYGQEAEAPR